MTTAVGLDLAEITAPTMKEARAARAKMTRLPCHANPAAGGRPGKPERFRHGCSRIASTAARMSSGVGSSGTLTSRPSTAKSTPRAG